MRSLWFAVLAVAAVAACYQPEAPACRVSCAGTGLCPAGLVCGQSDGLCHAPGAECSQVQPDATPTNCYGTAMPPFVQICDPPLGNALVFQDGSEIDTDADCTFTESQAGGPELCVIAAPSITIGAGTVRAVGARPLLLLGTLSVRVTGRLDVASHVAELEAPPAGAHAPGCAAAISGAAGVLAGGGGGAGGSFRAFGGGGREGGSGPNVGGAGGVPASQLPADTVVRGGCPGGGGGSSDGVLGVRGGDAGGAVYLMAGTALMIDGSINASGAGAGEAKPHTGGGGGGSGGMILLDAPNLVLGPSARLFALGGSGSAGGRTDALASAPGTDPAGPGMHAEGPAGAINGGSGGDGSNPVNPQQGGPGMTDNSGPTGGGGGGGGGSGGFIRVTPPQAIDSSLAAPTPY